MTLICSALYSIFYLLFLNINENYRKYSFITIEMKCQDEMCLATVVFMYWE